MVGVLLGGAGIENVNIMMAHVRFEYVTPKTVCFYL